MCIVAPNLYNALEIGHFQEMFECLDEDIRKACDEAFTRDLGLFSEDCRFFLRQAVLHSVRLRFRLLHPEVEYEFDYSTVETFDADIQAGWKKEDLQLTVPAVRTGDRTIAKGWVFHDRSNCEQSSK